MIKEKSIFYDIIKLYEDKKFKEVSKLVKERKISNQDRDNWLFNLACYYNHTTLANALLKIPSISIDGGNISDYIILHEDYIDPLQCAINNNNELLAMNILSRYKIDIDEQHISAALDNDMYDFVLNLMKCSFIKNAKDVFKLVKSDYFDLVLEKKPDIVKCFLCQNVENKNYYYIFKLLDNVKLSKTQHKILKSIFQDFSNYDIEIDKGFDYVAPEYAIDIALGLSLKKLKNIDTYHFISLIPLIDEEYVREYIKQLKEFGKEPDLFHIAYECFKLYKTRRRHGYYLFKNYSLKEQHFVDNKFSFYVDKLKKCYEEYSEEKRRDTIIENIASF